MRGVISRIGAAAAILAFPVKALAAKGGSTVHEHWSIFSEILPDAFLTNLQGMFAPTLMNDKAEHVTVSHVILGLLVLIIGFGLMFAANRKLRREEDVVLPPGKWSAFAFFDVMIESLLTTMERMMPREQAIRFLPLITAFAVFILIGNVMGLVPGLLPATDSLNTTFALGLVAFLAYNYWGIKQQGFVKYMKHFMGPLPALAPLMLPIELISHLVRPASLALRLMGNMYGDHMVLGIFLSFHIMFVPLPLMALGLLVCLVQTLVFTLLAIVYIALAIEDHDDHGHAEAH